MSYRYHLTPILEQDAVYTELGATALDGVEGNVSVSINGTVDTSKVGTYTITYSAKDSVGNEAHLTRTVRVVDVTPPSVTLNGDETVILLEDAAYTELGASAVDTVDGNVSVSINGTVDTTTIGEYILTYTATDSSGNSASVRRIVQVEQRFLPPSISISEELESTLAQSVVPYNRITLELNTTSTVKLTALNQTLEDEQNRSIQIKGVDNNGTFYLYNVPLVKGTNIIRLQATNGIDETVEQNITVNADANRSVPLSMSALEHEGVGSLETSVEVLTPLNVNEYLFDSDGNGTIDVTQTDSRFTVSYHKEGRYKPRVTVRTNEGLLYSSDFFELALDVKATAEQYDPVGATPEDVAKSYVEAFISGDRRRVEQLLGENQRRIHAIYDNPEVTAKLKEIYSNVVSWEQRYTLHRNKSTIRIFYKLGDKLYEGGFEMNVVHAHGTHGGRKWFIRLFY